jgi:hypothetical protein
MLERRVLGADRNSQIPAALAQDAGVASLGRVLRLLRDAKLPVSLFRLAGGRLDPLMLEYGLEEALGRCGLVEPLGDGAVLAILPRFDQDPGGARWRVIAALGAVLAREGSGEPAEIEMTELHCRADAVADSEDLMLQLLGAPRRTVAITAPSAADRPA